MSGSFRSPIPQVANIQHGSLINDRLSNLNDCILSPYSRSAEGLTRTDYRKLSERSPPKILESNLFTFLRQILHVKACSAISLTLLKAVFICTICTRCKFAPGCKFTPGCKFAPLALRSYAIKLCPYVHKFDMKFNTRYSVLRRNSLC